MYCDAPLLANKTSRLANKNQSFEVFARVSRSFFLEWIQKDKEETAYIIGSGQIDPPTVFDRHLGWGANAAKIEVNVWDFGRLWTAVEPLKGDRFPTFATTLNSFIGVVHSTESKAIRKVWSP